MAKYRKTALVEAEQFLPTENRIPAGVYSSERADPRKNPLVEWMLDTLEGPHVLRNGDYICTGPAGERWNVEQSIFEATYELATPDAPQAESETPTPEQSRASTPAVDREKAERIAKWIGEAIERAEKHGNTEGIWLFAGQWKIVQEAILALQSPPAMGEAPEQSLDDRPVNTKAVVYSGAASGVTQASEQSPAIPAGSFDKWLASYVGQQDASTMRFSLDELRTAFEAGGKPEQSDTSGGDRYMANRFKWAAPGDQQEDAWIVRFCDNDLREAIYTGPDAEREAWAAWERHAPSYNMYLFRLAALSQPTSAADEAERAWRDGWAECKARLCKDDTHCLTEDVEEDAWLDSKTRAALTTVPDTQGDGR